MSNEAAATKFTHDQIEKDLVALVADMTADWDLSFTGGVTPETRLMADLAFESIDVVQLVVAIEGHFGRRKMPFEQLMMVDGRYVQELQIKQIVDFLARQLDA
ncbi:MAG: acyl carrier protein [Proteobacteria bacterium]|nr:acyl carrier protein [Pseudomonadota bacterium]